MGWFDYEDMPHCITPHSPPLKGYLDVSITSWSLSIVQSNRPGEHGQTADPTPHSPAFH